MVIKLDKTIYDGLKDELKISHIDTKVKCSVRDIDHVGSKFTEAVKKEYGAQFIKDATYIIGFTEESVQEEEPKDEETEEKKDVENDAKVKDEGKDDSKTEKEELNESVKVQDLSKSMQLKTITPKATKTKCVKENESDKKKKKAKAVGVPIEIKKDDEGEEGGEDTGGDVGGLEEAETTATGADLKKKIIECIVRYFKLNQDKEEEKVELYDLPEFIEGKNVYFAKLTIKDNKQ